jgi:hypothetical protein
MLLLSYNSLDEYLYAFRLLIIILNALLLYGLVVFLALQRPPGRRTGAASRRAGACAW